MGQREATASSDCGGSHEFQSSGPQVPGITREGSISTVIETPDRELPSGCGAWDTSFPQPGPSQRWRPGFRALAWHFPGPGVKPLTLSHCATCSRPRDHPLGRDPGAWARGGHRVCGLSQGEQGLETGASGAGRPIMSLPCGAFQAGTEPWKPQDGALRGPQGSDFPYQAPCAQVRPGKPWLDRGHRHRPSCPEHRGGIEKVGGLLGSQEVRHMGTLDGVVTAT